jgi:hypothetical protein
MSFPPGATIYTFAGVSFIREREDIMQPWFFPESVYTKDPVLRGTKVYIDFGASVAPPLSFRARVLTDNDRAALKNALGSTGTLSNTHGRTGTVSLVKSTPMDGLSNQRLIDLTFELIPS